MDTTLLSRNRNDNQTKGWEQMVEHLEEEVTTLRQEKDRLLALIEKLTK